MPLPNIKTRANTNRSFMTISKKDAIFIIPREASLRDFEHFGRVKFATIDTKTKPVFAFCPENIDFNFSNNFKAHSDLVNAILDFKFGKNINENNIDKFSKKLIFGTYDLKKKKMVFCEDSFAENKEKLRKSVLEVLLNRLEKIKIKKNVEVSKKRFFPKITKIHHHPKH